MSEYNEGDLVEATNGETVIRGRIKCNAGNYFIGSMLSTTHALTVNGFTITVIEKAKPKVELPTEPGFYVGKHDFSPSGNVVIELLANGEQWVDSTDSHYLESDWVKGLGDLTRLESRAITAKAVLDQVRGYAWADGFTTQIEATAKKFGVTTK